jgi:FHA domain-containing protein
MSVLRTLESKLAGLVEGTFSRAFKSEVRPVEIARKLTKEMDQHRVQSLSRTYAPNEYAIWLSPEDRKQFEGYEDELKRELSGYLLEHARRERISLVTRPKIEFRTDERLRLGEFGIQARLVRPPQEAEEEPSQGDHGRTMVYTVSDRLAEPLREPDPRRGTARLRVGGRTELLGSGGAVLGRSREADVVIEDPNVSRKHAEVRQEGAAYWVVDLDSTNGMEVNGRRQKRAKLRQGDRITLGSTELVFKRETEQDG